MKLRNFIKNYIRFGDKNHIMYCIENGKIRPSKQLADALSSMLAGNREFYMIDEQKLVYENVMNTVRETGIDAACKKVFIIEGGPGTGKSVVAINLLVNITKMCKVVQYVTRNSAPRVVYTAKLTGTMKKTHINNLFQGSGSYHSIEKNTFDALIVDEAHRLNEKSGMFQNLGENQIKEIIEAAKVSIFFVDNDQVVTFKDIGHATQIREFAKKAEADVKNYRLASQFRCNGSSSYLAWLDYVLDIRQTANFELDRESYDFRVFDDPNELRKTIELKNLETNSARIVAGYCWDWKSKKDKDAYDIEIPEFNFKMKWNLSADGMLWILKENSISEAGCIHTCQGLELDYVGVIIGDDFVVRNGIVQTNPSKRSKMDQSVKGYKKLLKDDPDMAEKKADVIIKNTYKTLLTRGQKGCFIYCTDKETANYFKSYLYLPAENITQEETQLFPFTIIDHSKVVPFENSIPVVNFKAAAGGFSGFQNIEEFEWAILPEPYMPRPGYFVCQVTGESMNKKIPNGSWCLFKTDSGGTREGKTVLVEHFKIQDDEFGGKYTVKRYHSTKTQTEEGLVHSKIVLKPNSFFTHYTDIVLEQDDLESLKVVGELVAVLG